MVLVVVGLPSLPSSALIILPLAVALVVFSVAFTIKRGHPSTIAGSIVAVAPPGDPRELHLPIVGGAEDEKVRLQQSLFLWKLTSFHPVP